MYNSHGYPHTFFKNYVEKVLRAEIDSMKEQLVKEHDIFEIRETQGKIKNMSRVLTIFQESEDHLYKTLYLSMNSNIDFQPLDV